MPVESLTTQKTHTPKQKRLTDTDKGFALKYYADGLTQTEIAKRLGVTQSAISLWLSACTDSTDHARSYLRGRSLQMAEKVVRKGKPADLVKVLQGVSVLEQDKTVGVQVLIGIKDSDVSVTLTPGSSPVNALTSETK